MTNNKTSEVETTTFLPSLVTRYTSTFIDLIVVMLLAYGIATLLEKLGVTYEYAGALTLVFVIVFYEPLLISTFCTLGQVITNIRVVKHSNSNKRIGFFAAIIRMAIKVTLGWLSFITIYRNKEKRAIHDLVSGSMVCSLDE